MQLNFTPFPTLTTSRLNLRALSEEDVDAIFLLRTDDEVNKYLGRAKAGSIEDAYAFIRKIRKGVADNELIMWVATMKKDNRLLGTVGLWNINKETYSAEMGYELLPASQGRGIMHEAVEEIISFGFNQMGLKTITAILHENNERSLKILKNNHFFRDEIAEEAIPEEEKFEGNIVYTLKKE